MSDPRYAVDREMRKQTGYTANPNATPGAGRGTRNSGSPWGMNTGSATPRLDAGVQTPRLDSNPARSSSDALAASNRNGAFGMKAENLQKRRDLFSQMASADPAKRDAFKGQAAALGVTGKGWESAIGRLNMTPAATPATTAPAVAATTATPAPAQRSDLQLTGDAISAIHKSPGVIAARQKREFISEGSPQAKPLTSPMLPDSKPMPSWADTAGKGAYVSTALPGPNTPKPTKSPATPTTPTAPTAPTPTATESTTPQTSAQIETNQSYSTASNNDEAMRSAVAMEEKNNQGNGSRNLGAANLAGEWSLLANGIGKSASTKIFDTAAKAHVGASKSLAAASKAEKLGILADVAKNTSKTGSAARATFKAATAAQGAMEAKNLGTAASLTRTGNALEKVGSAAGKAGKLAGLGKLGAAAGKAAPWVTAAQGIYEAGALASSGERRQQRKDELEKAVSNKGAVAASARGALEGLINPVATIYATGAHASDALQSGRNAKEAEKSYESAKQKYDKVQAWKSENKQQWDAMSPKERMQLRRSL